MHSQVMAAITAAPVTSLVELSSHIAKLYAGGHLNDEQAQEAWEAIAKRRSIKKERPERKKSIFPPKRPVVRPVQTERLKRRLRRRGWSYQGWMLPAHAQQFSTGEVAVLSVVAKLTGGHGGDLRRTVAELAARAGVSVTTCKNAIRQAKKMGLITVQEQRRNFEPNGPNIITIVDKSWLAWLRRRGEGSKNGRPRIPSRFLEKETGLTSGASASKFDPENGIPFRPDSFFFCKDHAWDKSG